MSVSIGLDHHNDQSHPSHYTTTPQKRACGGGRPCDLIAGHVLGGGSAHNEMGYFRGSKLDYDEWADETGDSDWSYDRLLPLMKGLESAEPGLGSDEFRGRSGPIHVQENIGTKYVFDDFVTRWKLAAQELNYTVGDFHGKVNANWGPMQINVHHGRREDTDRVFLRPLGGPSPSGRGQVHQLNLDILTFAHVVRVLFVGHSAVGVEYTKGSTCYRVYADREVVLSAGALSTPQILMLSGIGPRAQLEKHGIRELSPLEGVGQNLQDHPATRLLYTTNVTDRDLGDHAMINEFKLV